METARDQFDQRDYSRAYDNLLRQAVKGNAEAQYAVGYMSYYGLGTPIDEAMAREWIRRSAEQNYPDAVLALKMIVHDPVPHQPDTGVGPARDKYPQYNPPNPLVYQTKELLKKEELM